jgi:hypothetical protein
MRTPGLYATSLLLLMMLSGCSFALETDCEYFIDYVAMRTFMSSGHAKSLDDSINNSLDHCVTFKSIEDQLLSTYPQD